MSINDSDNNFLESVIALYNMSNINFVIEAVPDKYREHFEKKSKAANQTNPDIIINPPGFVMPATFPHYMERIRNFEVFPDDTWVITFPKCGTTWTQEMVWLLKNNLDFTKAKDVNLRYRVPFLELEAIISVQRKFRIDLKSTIETSKNLARPRSIKCHLPVELLPKQLWTVKPKIVYVVRDPRDVAISYYYHQKLWNGYTGSLEEFLEAFLNDKVVYGPYWRHVTGFLNLKDKSHILINSYEEMKKDLPHIIRKTANFLNVQITDEEVEALTEHLSFKNMQKNNSVNYEDTTNEINKDTKFDKEDENLVFMRKGETCQWKNIFGHDILEKFKQWNEFHLKDMSFSEYPW